jgi:hypothetical protein
MGHTDKAASDKLPGELKGVALAIPPGSVSNRDKERRKIPQLFHCVEKGGPLGFVRGRKKFQGKKRVAGPGNQGINTHGIPRVNAASLKAARHAVRIVSRRFCGIAEMNQGCVRTRTFMQQQGGRVNAGRQARLFEIFS